MFRYRCPNAACGRTLSAPPIRAGRPSVCPGCARPLTIPADPKDWLPDGPAAGPAAAAAPAVAVAATPPELFPPSEPDLDLFAPIVTEAEQATARMPAPTPPPWAPPPPDSRPDEPPGHLWEPSPVETVLPPAVEAPAPAPRPGPEVATPAPRKPAAPLPVRAEEPAPAPTVPARVAVDPPAAADPHDPAELVAVLAGRRPPARPGGDLRPATALWLLLVGAGVVLLGLTLFTQADLGTPAVYLGAGLVEVGYLWAVWRAFRRSPVRGLACAVPPFTLGFLLRRADGDAQPLRYAAAGVGLIALGWFAPAAAPTTRAWVGADHPPATVARPDVAAASVPARLRDLADRRADDRLIGLLADLARTEPAGIDRAAVAAEVVALYRHPDPEVRAAAMAADAAWGGADARGRVLAAVGGPDRDDRLAALRLLPRWKDDGSARAAAGRLGKGGREGAAARAALVEIGGSVAERVVLPLLRHDEQGVRLAAIDLLADATVGGPAAAAELRAVAESSPDPGTRLAAAAAAERIGSRPPGAPAPGNERRSLRDGNPGFEPRSGDRP